MPFGHRCFRFRFVFQFFKEKNRWPKLTFMAAVVVFVVVVWSSGQGVLIFQKKNILVLFSNEKKGAHFVCCLDHISFQMRKKIGSHHHISYVTSIDDEGKLLGKAFLWKKKVSLLCFPVNTGGDHHHGDMMAVVNVVFVWCFFFLVFFRSSGRQVKFIFIKKLAWN